MAIAKMNKIMIASHRSEATELLEALQRAGIVQILDAERAKVSKEWPELQVKSARPRELEEMVSRLEKSIKFLEAHQYHTDFAIKKRQPEKEKRIEELKQLVKF